MNEKDRARREAEPIKSLGDEPHRLDEPVPGMKPAGKPVGVYDQPGRSGAGIWGTLAILIILALVAYLLFAFLS